jgi:hypothetical protein
VPEDLEPDESGLVHPGAGGLSVSPDDPGRLPSHRRPMGMGGTGLDPVWELAITSLGPELAYRPDPDDPDNHGFIEPRRTVQLVSFETALAASRAAWVRVSP